MFQKIIRFTKNIESFWYEEDNLDVDVSDDEGQCINKETVFIPKTEEDEWQSVELIIPEQKNQNTNTPNISQNNKDKQIKNEKEDDEERKVEILEKVIDKIVNDDPDDRKIDDFIPDPNKHTVKTYNPENPLPFSNGINDMFKNALNELIEQYKEQ